MAIEENDAQGGCRLMSLQGQSGNTHQSSGQGKGEVTVRRRWGHNDSKKTWGTGELAVLKRTFYTLPS